MHRMWSGGRKGKPDSSRNRSPFYRNGFPTPDTPPPSLKEQSQKTKCFRLSMSRTPLREVLARMRKHTRRFPS